MVKRIYHTIVALLSLITAGPAPAAEVNLNGVVGSKALLLIDNGKPRWVNAGESTPEGVRLVSVSGQSAVIELGGKRETLTMGQSARLASGGSIGAGARSAVLAADGQGHFITMGQINGKSARFLVDTGATSVSMGSAEAKRFGINYAAGQKAFTSTANGVAPVYRVKLDEVRLGDITLNNVDGVVHLDNSLPVILLGMSFLNRMEMKRDGEKMTLTKRF